MHSVALGIKCWEEQCEGSKRGRGGAGESSAEVTLVQGLSAGVGCAKHPVGFLGSSLHESKASGMGVGLVRPRRPA